MIATIQYLLQPLAALLLTLGILASNLSAFAVEADVQGMEFFEKKIRPLLADHCYQCHSAQAEKLKGGLFLDTQAGVLKGGDTGPAIVAGDPEKSLLIKAVRYTDEQLRMPPKDKKLTSSQIADLDAWVKMGAPDPRNAAAAKSSLLNPKSQGANHWAFKPVIQPATPVVRNKSWVRTPIDAFILSRLEEKKLTPSNPADKRTLIRRATYDLTGLPPTQREVGAFLADRSAVAFAKVVDRLLASAQYGERWARHWLDVARYSDTKGYVFEEERRYAYAYTYRDYVIRAFNEDVPYDRFIKEQLAADRLELGEDKRALAAMGFLTLGRRFLNSEPDIIDDRIDVVSRGLMGLTVGCARCHDHKYDPIPSKDYYSLYGVFASSTEPSEKPLLGTKSLPEAYPDYKTEHEKRKKELDDFRVEKESEAMTKLRSQIGDYLHAACDARKLSDSSEQENLARKRKLDPRVTRKWMSALEKSDKEPNNIFGPWLAFAALNTNEFASAARDLVGQVRSWEPARINPALSRQLLEAETPASLTNIAEVYNRVFADIDKQWTASQTNSPAPTALADPQREALRQLLYGESSPIKLTSSEVFRLFDTPAQQRSRALQRKVEELDALHPGSPPRAMVLEDKTTPVNPRVFIRGNAGNLGPEVPRQFLGVLSGENRKPFVKGSGRLELAESIANRGNPLTARVLVNRVWLHYFGSGLVRTPSDFGLRSEPPTHPELLDFLATRFMDEGWSLKKLQRLILLSNVYQQSSDEIPASVAIDPANQLLWRMNRRRLDFEAMRDSLLAVAGSIDLAMGGLPVELTTRPLPNRRTIYGFVERQNLPAIFRTFDFANPDATSPQRFNTTVPQQGLFMANSPFVVQQARSLARRPEVRSAANSTEKIRALYHATLQRDPSVEEIGLATRFFVTQVSLPLFEPEMPAWYYGYGNYEPARKRVTEFSVLPAFTNNVWQGSGNLPDAKLGWVMLNNAGGHPGNDREHAAIRRWMAPSDLVISINGTLGHDADKGDGVRGWIVSSGGGELGAWTAKKSKAETKLARVEIKKGEAIDFVVDCGETVDSDGFTWAPTIKVISSPQPIPPGAPTDWNARLDFGGPKEIPQPVTAWEKYAQVLLMSNELAFLD
ncbi:MAG: DUF1553 domain-containing protein [Pedosphaera sp.]|nr:DUF1553 domain-containing protein [Pedosphaera sp.]